MAGGGVLHCTRFCAEFIQVWKFKYILYISPSKFSLQGGAGPVFCAVRYERFAPFSRTPLGHFLPKLGPCFGTALFSVRQAPGERRRDYRAGAGFMVTPDALDAGQGGGIEPAERFDQVAELGGERVEARRASVVQFIHIEHPVDFDL